MTERFSLLVELSLNTLSRLHVFVFEYMYIRIKSITPLTGMIRNCSCKAQRDLSLPPDKSLCR